MRLLSQSIPPSQARSRRLLSLIFVPSMITRRSDLSASLCAASRPSREPTAPPGLISAANRCVNSCLQIIGRDTERGRPQPDVPAPPQLGGDPLASQPAFTLAARDTSRPAKVTSVIIIGQKEICSPSKSLEAKIPLLHLSSNLILKRK